MVPTMNIIQPQSFADDLANGHPNDHNITAYSYPMSTSQFRPQDPTYPYSPYLLQQDPVTDLPFYHITNTSVLNTFTPSLPKAPCSNSHPHPLVLEALESALRSKACEGVSERLVLLVLHFFRQLVQQFPLISARHLTSIMLDPLTPIGLQLLHAIAAFSLFALSVDPNSSQEARDCLDKARFISNTDLSNLSPEDTELLIATFSFVQFIESALKKE